jgi:hypothetical protein
MLLIITLGQRSPKVLMISAVWGRAPPAIALPYDPPDPPPDPATDHDWLSVMKTLAFSESAAAFGFSCAAAEQNHKKGHKQINVVTKVLFIATSGHKNLQKC